MIEFVVMFTCFAIVQQSLTSMMWYKYIDVSQAIKNGDLKVYILKDEFNIKNMSGDAWKEILKDKSKFELYNPNAKTIDMAVLAKDMVI